MARYDDLLSFCSPYHIMFIACRRLDFTDTLALEIDMHYMLMIFCLQNSLRFNLRASIFLGGMPPDPLALACYACWLCFTQLHIATITHYTKYVPHFNHVPLIREHNIFLNPIACQMHVHFQENHTALPPPVAHYILFCPFGQNPEINPDYA